MKNTGIVRHIDCLGRVVIPKEIRSTFGIAEGDPIEIYVDEDCIIFRKYQTSCTLCGENNTRLLIPFKDKLICKNCINLTSLIKDKANA
ncbi:MAG: AbrB/MazE/SpoVT family DNA-binding domain-containing protein [Oscillospiraceae bacterium]